MGMDSDEQVVVKIRGLPWSATKEDIIEFFDDLSIKGGKSGIHMTLSREGRPSGEAFIEFEDEISHQGALDKHKANMGNRYIEVFEVSSTEMEWILKRGNRGHGVDDECCLRLRGVPFGCTKDEIIQFFDGLDIIDDGVDLPLDFQGRQSGEAFVQFINSDMAKKAMGRHKDKIGQRYIEIFKSSKEEIKFAMHPNMRLTPLMGSSFGRPSPYDSRDRFRGSNRSRSRGSAGGGGRGFGGRGGGGGGFMDNKPPSWGGNTTFGMGFGRGMSSGGGGRGMKGGRGGGRSNRSGGSLMGHCVHMRGLPYRATEDDILEFFEHLNVVNVNIEFDKSGRPSGEADVQLATHEEAVEAMKKNRENMGSRYIELFLDSSPGGSSGGFGGGNYGMSGQAFGGGNFGMGMNQGMGAGSGGYSNYSSGMGYDNDSGMNQMGMGSQMDGINYSSFC